ncbi:unnamed protein product [Cuscuta europaea]|uniref:Uncharacterized protein n=1 Tax=Cuscuta europaea TaxID=41803 RepID=A0A9P0Z241_CUSEU|nr:unnamed protein product [Cuscuta europaea]
MRRETKKNIAIGMSIATIFLAIPIIVVGAWAMTSTSCVKNKDDLLEWVVFCGIAMLVSGIIGCWGAGCDETKCNAGYTMVMCICLVLMFPLIIILSVRSRYSGTTEKAPGRGYVEYRFHSFDSWLRGRVSNEIKWDGITTCMGISDGPCGDLKRTSSFSSSQQLYATNLTPLQAGCCIPLQSCNFTFVSPTSWTATNNQTPALDVDCARWNNDQSKLCLDCNSCRAGVLIGIRNKLIIACIVLAVFYPLALSACITFICQVIKGRRPV